MQLQWKSVEGTQAEEPAELEIGKTAVYLRKDIAQTTREQDDGSTISVWTYDEAKLTNAEYAEYLDETQGVAQQQLLDAMAAVDEANATLMLNQMDIMETQAMQDETLAEILLSTL